jgi:hypothetical protein
MMRPPERRQKGKLFAQDFFRQARELKQRRARRVQRVRYAADDFQFVRLPEKRQAKTGV